MTWIRERDALIAQTLAFVQSVTGRKEELRPSDGSQPVRVASVEVESVEVAAILSIDQAPVSAKPPAPVAPPQPLQVSPVRSAGDFRSEVQARVANFRKHQERFEREREEYCTATLAKLRAAIRDGDVGPRAGK